jgi:hypothetical protein
MEAIVRAEDGTELCRALCAGPMRDGAAVRMVGPLEDTRAVPLGGCCLVELEDGTTHRVVMLRRRVSTSAPGVARLSGFVQEDGGRGA